MTKECGKSHKKRIHIPSSEWDSVPVEEVTSLLYAIDGKRVFRLPPSATFTKGRLVNVIPTDGRKWHKAQTADVKNLRKGTRKIQTCAGSHLCPNPDCVYTSQFASNNNKYFFTSKKDGTVKCKFCEEGAVFKACRARKFTEFYDDHTIVKHTGQHSCPVYAKATLSNDIVEYMKTFPLAKAKDIQDDVLRRKLAAGASWEELKEEASQVPDRSNMHKCRAPNSIQAVQDLQQEFTKRDEFLIYTITNYNTTAVFKTSKFLLQLACDMDREGNHFLSNEYAHFDATHGRVKDHATFGLHVYHPVVRKLIRVVSMECSKEDTSAISFFETLNNAMSEVSGKATTFNPIGFIVDEYGPNHLGLQKVFGHEVQDRIATCAFHYKQPAKACQKLSQDRRQLFQKLGSDLFELVTDQEYSQCIRRLEAFTAENKELSHWLSWWDARRYNWAKAFRPKLNTPNSNLSECFFSTYKNENNLALQVDAAYQDALDAVKTESLLEGLEKGTASSGSIGKGPSQKRRREREKKLRSESEQEVMRRISTGTEVNTHIQKVTVTVLTKRGKRRDNKGKHGVEHSIKGRIQQPRATTGAYSNHFS